MRCTRRAACVCLGTNDAGEGGEIVGIGDPYAQTIRGSRNVEAVLKEAGFGLEDVVRTWMFVTNIEHWEEVGRAHGELFGRVRPATSMVECGGSSHRGCSWRSRPMLWSAGRRGAPGTYSGS